MFHFLHLLFLILKLLGSKIWIKIRLSFNKNDQDESLYHSYFRLRNQIQSVINQRYLQTSSVSNTLVKTNDTTLHIFCIVFNDYTFLPEIISKIKSSSKDQPELWIIDNSNNKNSTKEIRQLAESSATKYVLLPNNPFSGDNSGSLLNPFYHTLIKKQYNGSNSHGIALNWVCKNIIQPSGIHYYGFIDHDLIPINGVDILGHLKPAPFYGRKQDINGLSYLWPGFCFFNRAYIKPSELNFLPNGGADTGSGNAPLLVNRYNINNFIGSGYRKEKILEGNDLQDHYIEYIDEWLHVINASNWKNSDQHNKKIEAITKLKNQLF